MFNCIIAYNMHCKLTYMIKWKCYQIGLYKLVYFLAVEQRENNLLPEWLLHVYLCIYSV